MTRGVGELTARDIDTALDSGAATAENYVAEGLVCAAAICLQKETRIVGLRDANPQLIIAGAEDSARRVGGCRKLRVRKLATLVEEILHEGGPMPSIPPAARGRTGGDFKSLCRVVCR